MLPRLSGMRKGRSEDEEEDDLDNDDEIDLRAYELGLVDEEGNLLSAAQAKMKKGYEDLDRQCQIVEDLVQNDKNYPFVKFFEDGAKGTGGRGIGIVNFFKKQIDDFLVPPATRAEYEREQREMAKERAVLVAIERRKREHYVDDEEANKKADADKKRENEAIRGRLRSLDAPQVRFTPDNMHNNPSRGPLAAVPNFDYSNNQTFLLCYQGGRFQGTRQGFGTQKFEDGGTYEGEWKAGYQEGFGTLNFPSKDVYIGQWHMGLQDGLGILRCCNGSSYKGQWKAGKKAGFGESTDFRKGTIFGGEHRDGKRNGFGVKAWLRTGTAFMGEWINDKKQGSGLLRSNAATLGIGRFYTKWDDGKLIFRESYDPLRHGTEVLNAATWAAQYAAKAATDAALVVELKTSYPNAPRPRERMKDVTEQSNEEIPEHIQRFRETWMTKRESKASSRRPSINDGVHESQELKEAERIRVPARVLRRLIMLVHSADRYVEEVVVPILNDAVEVKDCQVGEEAFEVGQVWTHNMALLENYFAAKIQRKWKSIAWKRAIKGAKKHLDTTREFEMENQRRKAADLLAQLDNTRKLELEEIEQKINSGSLNTQLTKLVDSFDDNPAVIQLVKRSRKMFAQERKLMPNSETNDRWTFPRAESPRVPAGSSTIFDLLRKGDASMAEDDEALSDGEVELGKQIEANGIVYYGQVAKQIPHGFGTATYPDGSTYCGQFSHGKRDGVGEYIAEVEQEDRIIICSYIGEWKKNMRHGFAVEQSKLADVFEQLLASTRVEYKNDELVHSEPIDESTCAEWIKECSTATIWAKRASLEAKEMFNAKAESKFQSGLSLSKLILFSFDEGFVCYSGPLDIEHGRHGCGVQDWDDGQRYAGEWVDDAPEGFGREDYADGSTYTGQFKCGKRWGKGRFTHHEGKTQTIYLGEWMNGMREGRGIERQEIENEEGNHDVQWVATVEYKNDVITHLESYNHVRMRDFVDDADHSVRNGARAAGKAFPATRIDYPAEKNNLALWYVGGRLDGQRAGSGVLMMRDGTKYVGDFLHDNPDGYGVESYPDGSVYTGQFKNSHRHGFGKYVTARGMMHLGEWNKGMRQGRALQRSLVQLASGSIAREYLLDFVDDEEKDRRLVTSRHLPWIKQAETAVARAEETQELTIGIYQDLLD